MQGTNVRGKKTLKSARSLNASRTVTSESDVVVDNLDVNLEDLAKSIEQVAQATRKINDSRLNRKAILILIQQGISGSISRVAIEAVLDTAADLDRMYLKKARRK